LGWSLAVKLCFERCAVAFRIANGVKLLLSKDKPHRRPFLDTVLVHMLWETFDCGFPSATIARMNSRCTGLEVIPVVSTDKYSKLSIL
jgi:hypothetical protein